MPVWLTVFLTLSLPISTLAGAWAGARVSRQGAENAAKLTLEGQRQAALRDYRTQQIAPYLEAARQRLRVWYEIALEVGIGGSEKWVEMMPKYTSSEFGRLIATHFEIPDSTFRAAFQKFYNAERVIEPTDSPEEILDKMMLVQEALMELAAEAQRYIFAAEKEG